VARAKSLCLDPSPGTRLFLEVFVWVLLQVNDVGKAFDVVCSVPPLVLNIMVGRCCVGLYVTCVNFLRVLFSDYAHF
jgi:hypothetical protein